MDDQCGDGDLAELVPGVVTAARPSVQCLGARRRLLVEEGLGTGPAGAVGEEQRSQPPGVATGQIGGGPVAAGHPAAIAPGGGAQDQRSEAVGVVDRQPLGHPAAHGVSVDVGPPHPGGVQHGQHIVGQRPSRVPLLGALLAVARAALVEGDHAELTGQLGHDRVPGGGVHGLAADQQQGLAGAALAPGEQGPVLGPGGVRGHLTTP